jgi:hypothetical protein
MSTLRRQLGSQLAQDMQASGDRSTLRGALMRDAKDSITDAIRIANVGGSTISTHKRAWTISAMPWVIAIKIASSFFVVAVFDLLHWANG